MFEKLKSRIGNLEYETEQLKAELAKLRTELAEVKQTLSRVLGENRGLRQENDRLIKLGLCPGYPRVRRHDWPNSSVATPE